VSGTDDLDVTVRDPAPPTEVEPPQARPSVPSFDDVTVEAPTARTPAPAPAAVDDDAPVSRGRAAIALDLLRAVLKRYERVLWWLHTAWALCLGTFVATFAQKGFEQARMLLLSLVGAWVLVVFFFRLFGTGAQQDFATAWPDARRRFFVVTYLMKNLFQGMLFFLLPFYWRSSSVEAGTAGPLVLLAVSALLSTLDLVFDRVLLRFKVVASLFFAVTAFGCIAVVVPALAPEAPSLVSLLVASGLSLVTFVLFHVPLATLARPVAAGAFVSFVFFGVLGAYAARRVIPPVPCFVKSGGVGLSQRSDGTLGVEVRVLRLDDRGALPMSELYAVTDVAVATRGDRFRHVWRRGEKVFESTFASVESPRDQRVVRVATRLLTSELGVEPFGNYAVDVETEDGQVVGRVRFDVAP
jgi:hypothetical protein